MLINKLQMPKKETDEAGEANTYNDDSDNADNESEDQSDIDDNNDENNDDEQDADEEDIDVDANFKTDNKNENCVYIPKHRSKNNSKYGLDKDDDDDDDTPDQNSSDANVSAFVPNNERITGTKMTNYERVRLLSTRIVQLTNGAKPMLKDVAGMSKADIARNELDKKVIPIDIIRPLPNGKKERWTLEELVVL